MRLTGVTQVQVGEGAGLSQPYVSQILAGNTPKLPLNRAQALAAFFGCAIEDLFPVHEEVA
jgi:transcriptional regulator with XRE-family HTH domain